MQNFNDFGVVAVILVAMIGVGVAEEAGLIAALIRKMVQVAPAGAITFIIVLLGGISSVASDAGYLVLIPLGAAAFASLGRNPLVGIAAAYAGVSASFFVNILITPADGIITEVTNEIMGGVAPNAEPLNVTNNFYFAIVSTLFSAVVMTILTERYIEPGSGSGTRPSVRRTRPWTTSRAGTSSRTSHAGCGWPGSTASWPSRSSRR